MVGDGTATAATCVLVLSVAGTGRERRTQFASFQFFHDLGRADSLRAEPGFDPRILQVRQGTRADLGEDDVGTPVARQDVYDGAAIHAEVLLKLGFSGFPVGDHHPLGFAEMRR